MRSIEELEEGLKIKDANISTEFSAEIDMFDKAFIIAGKQATEY